MMVIFFCLASLIPLAIIGATRFYAVLVDILSKLFFLSTALSIIQLTKILQNQA